MGRLTRRPTGGRSQGFTLLEILITLMILGVLAGLAIPIYSRRVEESRANEATVNLNAIYMGQKIYALNNSGDYWNGGVGPAVADINTTLNIDINPQFYDIASISAANGANPKTFVAVATRNNTSGGDGVTSYRINDAGVVS